MSVDYCHKHHQFFDTDETVICPECLYDEPVYVREAADTLATGTSKAVCFPWRALRELPDQNPTGNKMGLRSCGVAGEWRDE